jgi:uncharacterized protein
MKKSSKSDAKSPKSGAKKSAAKGKPAPKSKPAKRSSTVKAPPSGRKVAAATRKPARKAAPAARSKKIARADIDNLGDLPRSYGDEKIFVIAQEPHWLFCYWDYTLTEGVEGVIFLRHGREGTERPEAEVPVPAETNSWYLSVRDADADYYVELGHYNGGHWKTLTRSGTVLTPRDTLAGFGDPVFANMPFHATFQQLVEKLRGEMREGESLAAALARLQGRGDLPPGASLFSGGLAQSSWGAGAASWAQAPGGFSSAFLGLPGASWESALGSWSSAAMSSWGALSSWGSSWTPREFFMHLNAEVIFYGGTHPDAKVTIAGKEIMIRPDGTFRYHFVFPDGEFEIPITATSPDGVETRRGVLRFERATAREGDVGSTAQPLLGAPMGRKA